MSKHVVLSLKRKLCVRSHLFYSAHKLKIFIWLVYVPKYFCVIIICYSWHVNIVFICLCRIYLIGTRGSMFLLVQVSISINLKLPSGQLIKYTVQHGSWICTIEYILTVHDLRLRMICEYLWPFVFGSLHTQQTQDIEGSPATHSTERIIFSFAFTVERAYGFLALVKWASGAKSAIFIFGKHLYLDKSHTVCCCMKQTGGTLSWGHAVYIVRCNMKL